MTRRRGILALLLSAWLSGLVLASERLSFESPLALRHPGDEPVPSFEPPAEFCEPLFVEQGCFVREDLDHAQHGELERLLERRGQEVERWRGERRQAWLTADWWRGGWPPFAVLWSALAALAAVRLRRVAGAP